ncbi:MAG: ShlB/FhaC/HecB family hemolysin secretion/activation protein [Pleurocapsa sp.]
MFLSSSSLLLTPSALAQTITPVTPDVTPKPQPQPLPPREKPLNPDSLQPPTPESVLDIPGTIVVRQFEFVGSTVFSSSQLQGAIAEFTDKPISFAQLLQAANKITELYLQEGYITSGAYIPAQNLRSDTVKIQILEGGLADIDINVTKGNLKPKYVRDRLENATSTPLNINRLQEALQLLQLDPRIDSLKAELAAGTTPGTNLLTVSVIGAKTFTLQPSINNNRNPSVGSFERRLGFTEADLLGWGDELTFAYSNTDGSDRFEGSYTLPINTSNGSLSFNYRISDNKIIESPFEQFDIEVDARDFDFTWRQPLIRQANAESSQEFALSLTASRRESDTFIGGINSPLTLEANEQGETRISALRLSQEWLERSRQQVFAVNSQFNLGIDAFNATVNNDEADSRFFSWRGQVLYLRRLGAATSSVGTTVLLRSDLQLATEPLLTLEQFSLGGGTTVRGYRQDTLLTDNGWLISAETRLPLLTIPQVQGTLQFIPFIDLGIGWNTDNQETEFNTLIGTGMGFLWEMQDKFSARLDWGIPLVNNEGKDDTWQENGVYFQVQYDIQ